MSSGGVLGWVKKGAKIKAQRWVGLTEPPSVKEERHEQEEDPVNKLARMIMQHEREQREVAMSRYDRLLGFVLKKSNATQGEGESESENEACARDRQVCSGAA